MLKKLFLNFLSGFAIGTGIALVAYLIITKIDHKDESEFVDGDISEFSLSSVKVIKTGGYLRLTGKILGNDFSNVESFQVRADIKLDGEFIERCWGKGFKDSSSEIWYYSIECDDITAGHFDLPFSHNVFIKSARLYKR